MIAQRFALAINRSVDGIVRTGPRSYRERIARVLVAGARPPEAMTFLTIAIPLCLFGSSMILSEKPASIFGIMLQA